MRTDPQLKEIVNGERGMIRGIEACVERECLVSAIALIYAALDSLSALTRPIAQTDTTNREFKDWTSKYLLPEGNLKCSAEELYGARCGVLHTHSSESAVQRKSGGSVKQLVYCWKAGPVADAEKPLPKDATTIVVDDLLADFKAAVKKFLAEIEQDSELAKTVAAHLGELLCYKPFEVVTVHVAA